MMRQARPKVRPAFCVSASTFILPDVVSGGASCAYVYHETRCWAYVEPGGQWARHHEPREAYVRRETGGAEKVADGQHTLRPLVRRTAARARVAEPACTVGGGGTRPAAARGGDLARFP